MVHDVAPPLVLLSESMGVAGLGSGSGSAKVGVKKSEMKESIIEC